MEYTYVQLTDPVTEPVSLAEIKNWCAVDHDDDDASLTADISAARVYAETHTGRIFGSRSFKVMYSQWPCGDIMLPIEPVTAVVSIGYTDYEQVTGSVSSDNWRTWLDHSPPIVRFVSGYSRPSLSTDEPSPVTILVTAGESEYPQTLRKAIKLIVQYWRENPGGERAQEGNSRGIPQGAIRLLDSLWTGAL